MSRTRMIKPAFFKHADLYNAERESGLPLRLAFAGLWTVTDKEGRFSWKHDLKPDVLPYDPVDILDVLNALERYGFVRRYVVGGKSFGLIPSFSTHQTFHRTERQSTLPEPPQDNVEPPVNAPVSNGRLAVGYTADTVAVTGTVSVVQALGDQQPSPRAPKRQKREEPPLFGIAWSLYPRRAGSNPRTDALSQWLARVREGASEAEMLAGVERYKAFCDAMQKTGTETVMQARRFFGRNREFSETWDVPKLVQSKRDESDWEREKREDRERAERQRIAGIVSARRSRADGDEWWQDMQRQAGTTNLGAILKYASQHTEESAA